MAAASGAVSAVAEAAAPAVAVPADHGKWRRRSLRLFVAVGKIILRSERAAYVYITGLL